MNRYIVIRCGCSYVYEAEDIFDLLCRNFSGDEYSQIEAVILIPKEG